MSCDFRRGVFMSPLHGHVDDWVCAKSLKHCRGISKYDNKKSKVWATLPLIADILFSAQDELYMCIRVPVEQ